MAELKTTATVTAIEFSKAQFEVKKHPESDVMCLHIIAYTGTHQTRTVEVLTGITDNIFLLAENIKQIKELGESLVNIGKKIEERELSNAEKYAFRLR